MAKKNKPTVTVLGNTYVDIISGFEGMCVAKAQYLTGCDQSCLRPKKLNKDGDGAAKGEWFDDSVLVQKEAPKFEVNRSVPRGAPRHSRSGGPNADTPSVR
jgi:hypothetical protein